MHLSPRTLLLAAAALAAGCVSTPLDTSRTSYKVAEGFASRRPADVAVLPVGGALSEAAATALRDSLRRGLLDRRFAPVRNDAVDRDPKEHRPGGATAVLVVTVEKWDDSALYGVGTVRMSATARLHAASTGEILYEARFTDVKVNAGHGAQTMEDRTRSVSGAASDAAERILAKLPVKGDG